MLPAKQTAEKENIKIKVITAFSSYQKNSFSIESEFHN
jgi:hypothetical protein